MTNTNGTTRAEGASEQGVRVQRAFAITGDRARELLAELKDVRDRGRDEIEALQKQKQAEMDAVFARIADAAGVGDFDPFDPRQSWTVDSEFLDEHGVIYLKRETRGHDPLAALLGGEG